MNLPVVAPGIDINGPGAFAHWSIFTVTVADLVLIAVPALVPAPL